MKSEDRFRNEFVRDVHGIIEIHQCFHQCGIMSLLRSIDFMPSRNTSRVELAQHVDVFTDGRTIQPQSSQPGQKR